MKNQHHHHFVQGECISCPKKIYPQYDEKGNVIMTDKIWNGLSFWDKLKLNFVLQYFGKFMVKT